MPLANFQRLLKQNRKSLLRKPQSNRLVQRTIQDRQRSGRTPLNNFALRAIRQRQQKQAEEERRQRENERIQALQNRTNNLPTTSDLAVRFDPSQVRGTFSTSPSATSTVSQPSVTNSPTDLRPNTTSDSTLDSSLPDDADDLFARRRPDLPF